MQQYLVARSGVGFLQELDIGARLTENKKVLEEKIVQVGKAVKARSKESQ